MTTTGADGGIDIRLKKNQEDGADQKEIYVQSVKPGLIEMWELNQLESFMV